MQERVPKKGIKAKYSLRLEEFHEKKKKISLYSETAPRNVLEKVYEEVRLLRTWNIFVRFEKLRTSQRVSLKNYVLLRGCRSITPIHAHITFKTALFKNLLSKKKAQWQHLEH